MAGKANMPEIRFAGFTDPWEQRKLGEMFAESAERSSELEILSVSVSRGIYPASESERDSDPGASIANYKVVHVGDVVYNSMRMWQGAVDASLYNGIVSPAYVVARPSVVAFPRFFSRILKRPQILHRYRSMSQGNSKDTLTLKFDQFAQIAVETPVVFEEQKMIATLFDRLDSLITLHQRKYDKLVQLKKSMLGKMFPKSGETEPEIRFAGFTDPWEQRKLGDFSSKRTEKNTGGTLSETFTNSAEYGVISQLDFFDHGIANDEKIDGYYIVEPEDFVYNPRISTIAPCGPISRNCLGRPGVISPLYMVFRVDESVDRSFLEYYFKTNLWHKFMFLEGNSGARSDRFSIANSAFYGMPICCPTIEEQIGLSTLFAKLDSLITLHQRKLELLKNTKKSLLDKMFV